MNKTQLKDMLEQTAKDYDMEVWEVERIYNKYPYDEFYKELEAFIKDRE
jgi:hypothetical protein